MQLRWRNVQVKSAKVCGNLLTELVLVAEQLRQFELALEPRYPCWLCVATPIACSVAARRRRGVRLCDVQDPAQRELDCGAAGREGAAQHAELVPPAAAAEQLLLGMRLL